MRVTVLHNAVPPNAPLEDQDTLVQVETVVAALSRLGHEAAPLACTLDLASLQEQLRRRKPDLVFNLVESLGGADSLIHLPPAVLDVLRIPYTGSRADSLFLTTHKLLAKQRLHHAGLPTPPWMENLEHIHEEHQGHEDEQNTKAAAAVEATTDPALELGTAPIFASTKMGLPPLPVQAPQLPHQRRASRSANSSSSCPSRSSWILKGLWEQGSRGMDDDAVLQNLAPDEVSARLRRRTEQSGRPCFAEQFIDGREFSVAMLAGPAGPELLPPAEIDFSAFPPEKNRIVDYRAKWDSDSFEYHHTPPRFTFDRRDEPLLNHLRGLARQCWPLFDLRGWVRVDFRVDAAGNPWILEINANPCLSLDAGFAAALQQASIPFDAAIQRILDDAL